MRLLLSISILIISISGGCSPKVDSNSLTPKEESSSSPVNEIPETIVIPVSSLGEVSEVRKQILQNTLEDELKSYFRLISQERFEEVQEKVFEELEYDECTEDQCIMRIQEMLQVENVFHLQVLGEGSDTQLSLSWRTLDFKKKETGICVGCGTIELNGKVSGLVKNLLEVNKVSKIQKITDNQFIEDGTYELYLGDIDGTKNYFKPPWKIKIQYKGKNKYRFEYTGVTTVENNYINTSVPFIQELIIDKIGRQLNCRIISQGTCKTNTCKCSDDKTIFINKEKGLERVRILGNNQTLISYYNKL